MALKTVFVLALVLMQMHCLPMVSSEELPTEVYVMEEGQLRPLCPFHPACVIMANRQVRSGDQQRMLYGVLNKKSRFGSNVRLTK